MIDEEIMRIYSRSIAIACLALCLLLNGCYDGPSSLHVSPAIDSSSDCSLRALEAHDRNNDGYLAGDELSTCPGLLMSLEKIDSDGDKRISVNELQARLDQWLHHDVGLVSFACRVTANGRPLEGAEVKLVPEEFLGSGLKTAIGHTDSRGNAVISLPASDLPPGNESRRVMQPGIYRVQITHPRTNIPRVYNQETILGCEVAFDSNRLEVPQFTIKTP